MSNTNPLIDAPAEAVTCRPTVSEMPTRICQRCQGAYPITQFRFRAKSGPNRMKQCRLCHNQTERLRRQRKRGWLTARQFRQYLTSLKNQSTARGVERVYLTLIEQFGGTEGVMRMWSAAMDKDLAKGGFRAYRHIASVISLMQHYETAHSARPDYSRLSDEELLDRLART